MFSLPFAGRKEKVVAILDIGSGSVGYCLVQVERDAPPKILASERLLLPFEERTAEQTRAKVLTLLGEACEKAVSTYAQAVSTKRKLPISAVYAILRAPWVRSEFARAQTEFESDQRITEEAIGELARQALASENKLNHQNLFEAGVVSVELNGYATKKPLGKLAHNVSITAIISECEPDFRADVTEALQRAFPSAGPNLRSTTRVLLSSLQDGRAESGDRVVIDVENEATNCLVMREGIVAENFLVPEGTRTILARITTGMLEETFSLMRMMSRGTCSTPACDKLNASLARMEPELAKIFGDALGRLTSSRRLPNELILIAEPELSDWLSVFFSRIDFCQFTITARPFAVTTFNFNDIRIFASRPHSTEPMISRSSQAEFDTIGVADAGLAIAASLVNAEEQSTD